MQFKKGGKMRTKKISLSILSVVAMLLCLTFVLTGCKGDDITPKNDATILYGANYTNWYEYNSENYLDTSVTINFDKIKVEDIDKVTFEIYNGETLLGNAVSKGNNLETLLKDCAQYWDKTADTYLEVKGARIMSCAFKTRAEEEDNNYWVRSKCTIEEGNLPSHVVVKMLVGNVEYVTSSAK